MGEVDRMLLASMLDVHGLDAVLHELAKLATRRCHETARGHDVEAAKGWAYAAEALEMTAAACAAV